MSVASSLAITGLLPSSDVTTATAELMWLWNTYMEAGIVVVGIVMLVLAYLMIKYRSGSRPEPEDAPQAGKIPSMERGNIKLAVVFWIILFLLFIPISVATFDTITKIEEPPEDAIEIEVMAQRYNFQYTYPNGQTSLGTLHIPEDQAVDLKIKSRDVMHNYYVPKFKVMKDAIPGQTNEIWFQVNEPGTYDAYCNEFCGDGHTQMTGSVDVMTQSEWQNSKWSG